jgi:hypothetical protein
MSYCIYTSVGTLFVNIENQELVNDEYYSTLCYLVSTVYCDLNLSDPFEIEYFDHCPFLIIHIGYDDEYYTNSYQAEYKLFLQ